MQPEQIKTILVIDKHKPRTISNSCVSKAAALVLIYIRCKSCRHVLQEGFNPRGHSVGQTIERTS